MRVRVGAIIAQRVLLQGDRRAARPRRRRAAPQVRPSGAAPARRGPAAVAGAGLVERARRRDRRYAFVFVRAISSRPRDPPARRGASESAPSCRVADPQGHRSLPRGAPVEEERDEVRHNVLRDGRRRNNGHGVTRSGPSTGASRRGGAHDPVSTNDGPTGDRGTRGGDRGVLRRGERSAMKLSSCVRAVGFAAF